jgi:hypothetical protein
MENIVERCRSFSSSHMYCLTSREKSQWVFFCLLRDFFLVSKQSVRCLVVGFDLVRFMVQLPGIGGTRGVRLYRFRQDICILCSTSLPLSRVVDLNLFWCCKNCSDPQFDHEHLSYRSSQSRFCDRLNLFDLWLLGGEEFGIYQFLAIFQYFWFNCT